VSHSLVFNAYGTPRPQPRPRFVGGRAVSTANPKAKLWRAAVERAVKEVVANGRRATPLFTGPVRVRCTFRFTGASSRADCDNLAKLVMDVMEAAGVFANDRQVVELIANKMHGCARAGVAVMVEDMSEEAAPGSVDPLGPAPGWLR
jgi:Holliday junction resolvase RusA-like endonuclease